MAPDLIKNLEEIQQNVPVAMTTDFDRMSPFLRSAEVQFVTKLIGKEQVLALKTAYDANTADEKKVEAIGHCQKVIANLGYYLAVPMLSVSVGGNGIQIFSDTNTKNAFQWQVEDLRDSLLNLGFNAIEELLEFLESEQSEFPEYSDSDQYKEQQSLMIRSAAEFDKFYKIDSSRFIYQNILSLMRRVEDQTMSRLFGADFYDSLKADELSAEKKLLVDRYIKPGLALLTAAKALIERVITLEGAKVAFNFKGNYNNIKESMAATAQQIKATTDQLEKDGNDFISAGLQLIIDKPTGYEEFVPPAVKRRFKFNNDPEKGVFGV